MHKDVEQLQSLSRRVSAMLDRGVHLPFVIAIAGQGCRYRLPESDNPFAAPVSGFGLLRTVVAADGRAVTLATTGETAAAEAMLRLAQHVAAAAGRGLNRWLPAMPGLAVDMKVVLALFNRAVGLRRAGRIDTFLKGSLYRPVAGSGGDSLVEVGFEERANAMSGVHLEFEDAVVVYGTCLAEGIADVIQELLLTAQKPASNPRNGPVRDEVADRIRAKFETNEGVEQLRDCTTETAVAKLIGVSKQRLNENPSWIDPVVPHEGETISRKQLWQLMRHPKPKTRNGWTDYGTRDSARDGLRKSKEHFHDVDAHLDEAVPGFGD